MTALEELLAASQADPEKNEKIIQAVNEFDPMAEELVALLNKYQPSPAQISMLCVLLGFLTSGINDPNLNTFGPSLFAMWCIHTNKQLYIQNSHYSLGAMDSNIADGIKKSLIEYSRTVQLATGAPNEHPH